MTETTIELTDAQKAARALGALGGAKRSKAKTEAARLNAQKRWAMVRAKAAKKKTREQKAVTK